MIRPSSWHEHHRDHDRQIVYIVDANQGGMSITNDAQGVLNYHRDLLGSDWRVVYQDTQGEWWEIVETYVSTLDQGVTRIEETLGFEPWSGLAWDILKTP